MDPTAARAALRLVDLTVGYRQGRRGVAVLTGLGAVARRGELTVLLGPNGTGKSTLLRTVAGLQPPLAGGVLLDGVELGRLHPRERARRVGVVLTDRVDLPLGRGRELVSLGRHPHTDLTGRLTDHDRDIVTWAIDAVDAGPLAERRLDELSDGERQRLLVARALAQRPALLLLDEPSAFLDVPARVALIALLRRLARERDLAVVVSTHDLELALRAADAAWLLDRTGTLHAASPEELILDGLVGAVFDRADLRFDPVTAAFVVHPPPLGTARVLAGPPDGRNAAVAAALERALGRDGWRLTASGPVDLEIDGRHVRPEGVLGGAADGVRTALPDTAAALRWIRERTAARAAGAWPTRRADPTRTATTLGGLAEIGPYFAVTRTDPGAERMPGAVLSAAALYGDRAALDRAVAELAERMGTEEARVAASALFLGHAARLWSVALGCWARGGTVPDLPADLLGVDAPGGSPVRLLLADAGGWRPADPGDLPTAATLLVAAVIDGHLRPMAAALRAGTRLAEGLLWGNAAAALVGAVRVLDGAPATPAADGAPSVPPSPSPRGLAAEVLRRAPLAGAGRWGRDPDGGLDPSSFVRRSCCLFYRTPGGGTCGDCPLTPAGRLATRAGQQPVRTISTS